MLLKILNKYQRISNKKYQKGDQNYEDQARMYRKNLKKVNKIIFNNFDLVQIHIKHLNIPNINHLKLENL